MMCNWRNFVVGCVLGVLLVCSFGCRLIILVGRCRLILVSRFGYFWWCCWNWVGCLGILLC